MTAGVLFTFFCPQSAGYMLEKVLFVDVVADVEHDAKVAIKSGNTKNQVAITRKKM